MGTSRREVDSRVRDAVREVSPEKRGGRPSDRFLVELGFDSLRMVALSLALEDAFERPLLLNDWLSGSADVTRLTLDSLCHHVHSVVTADV